MLVECTTEDFSDPEAVSGSSTTIQDKSRRLGIFSCRQATVARLMQVKIPSRRLFVEAVYLNDSTYELEFDSGAEVCEVGRLGYEKVILTFHRWLVG